MSYSRGSKYGHGRGSSYGGGAERGFDRGSLQGFVVLVQNGKVGNNIKVRVTQVGDRSAKATTVV